MTKEQKMNFWFDNLLEYRTVLLGFPVVLHTDHKPSLPHGNKYECQALEIASFWVSFDDALHQSRKKRWSRRILANALPEQFQQWCTTDGWALRYHWRPSACHGWPGLFKADGVEDTETGSLHRRKGLIWRVYHLYTEMRGLHNICCVERMFRI